MAKNIIWGLLRKMNMKNRTSNQRDYWNKEAETYAKRYGLDSPNGIRKIERKAQMLIDGAGITDESDILEIGCGIGTYTKQLAQTEAMITALDISPQMVQIAINNHHPNVFYMVDDIHKTVFKDARFDAVVGCYILQYLDLSVAIPEIKRILKPGGKFAFIDINALNPIAFAKTRIPWVKRAMNISDEAVSFADFELWKLFITFNNVRVTPFEFGNKSLNFLENIPIIQNFSGNLLVTGTK